MVVKKRGNFYSCEIYVVLICANLLKDNFYSTFHFVFLDFQKTAGLIQEFLSKLSCEESTAELRDSMNLVLFYLQKYYKKLRSRSVSNGTSPRFNSKSPSGSLIFNGGISPVSPACGIPDQFEWKWYNLESPRLSASLGTNEFSSLPLILQAAKSGDSGRLRELIDKGKINYRLRG